MKIPREELLIIKKSGKYKCPNYVPPFAMEELLADYKLEADEDTVKLLAEISENFAISLIQRLNGEELSTSTLRKMVDAVNFD